MNETIHEMCVSLILRDWLLILIEKCNRLLRLICETVAKVLIG